MLQDIAHQRDNLVGQAEQVRSAISGVQIDLRHDIALISDAIASRVDEVAKSITGALEERGAHITSALSNAGDNMILALGERGGDLLDRLEEASAETTRAVLDASERLTTSLNFKTGHVHDEFVDLADRVHEMLNERIDRITAEFEQRSSTIVDGISDRTEQVHDSLKNSSDSLLLELELRSGDLVSKIDDAGNRLATQILTSGDKASEALDVTVNSLVAKVVSQTETAHDTLSLQMSAFDELVKNQGGELAEKFARDSGTLGALITRHISEFDRTVKTFGGEIVERMGQRTQDIADSLKSYVDTFDTRLTSNGGEITASLDQRLLQFETTLGTRVTHLDTSLDSKISRSTSRSTADSNRSNRPSIPRAKSVTETIDGRLGTLDRVADRWRRAGDPVDRPAPRPYLLADRRHRAGDPVDRFPLTHLTTSLTRRPRRAVDQRIANDRDHRWPQHPVDRNHRGAVPGNSSGHRDPHRLRRHRHRHTGVAVRGTAGFTHRSRGRPHRKQRTAGQRWPGGARRTIVGGHQVPCRGRRTLAFQPCRHDQRDHPDRRTRGAGGPARRLLGCRRSTQDDLRGSGTRADRRRQQRRQFDRGLGPRGPDHARHGIRRCNAGDQVKSLASDSRALAVGRRQRNRRTRFWPARATFRYLSLPAPTSSGASSPASDPLGSRQSRQVARRRRRAHLDGGRRRHRGFHPQQRARGPNLAHRDLGRCRKPDPGDLERLERSLSTVTTNTTDRIAATAQTAQQAMIAASNEASSKVKSTSADVERSVLAASGSFGSAMTGKTDEIVTYVQQQTDRLSQTIDSKRGALVEAIGAKTSLLTSEVDRVTAEALRSIETRGQGFSQAMLGNSTEVARNITSAGELAASTVNKSLKDLELASRNAIDQSRQVSIAAVTEMQETSKILRTDTVALFERLREGNILLQEVLTGAHDNLNSLERALVTRVADFVSAMNDVTTRNGAATQTLEDQLSVFNSKTSKALEDLNSLSSQFEIHGRSLVEAAAVVEQSNRSTSTSLAERKSTLESLVNTIDLRTTDLDQRLSRFTVLLDELLAAAEERARDIARVVAETAGAGSAAISRQFEAVRAAAEEERRQTSDAMAEIYQQSTEEADAMFKQSADKFANMVGSMKQMAAEMQRELEATRNELRRGVLEMPQEAADLTAQMRKVIVDQIEALAELNRIVAHHGRGLDVVSTTSRTTSSYREEEPALAAAVGGRAEPPRSAPRASASTLPPPDLGQPAARRTEAPPVAPAGSDQGRDGWLSDLLSRTDGSAGAPPPAPPRGGRPAPNATSGNPLELLSLDIGRLMDRNLAAEMWDRYQRGESKAFTKRLYTPAGQKAFDEVARKYRSDRNFKQTVDRYIAEFERLLDEVAREDRGPQALRSHLTSETGLVYTLLAHAAGRLG